MSGQHRHQLDLMLQGLETEDLPIGTQIVSTIEAKPACVERFRWANCTTHAERFHVWNEMMPLFGELGLILFFCDLTDDSQYQGLLELVFYIDGNRDAPPLLCVQVS